MIKAILNGNKTQARRLHTQKGFYTRDPYTIPTPITPDTPCPYGQPGDILYVRETWATSPKWDKIKPSKIPEHALIFYYTGPFYKKGQDKGLIGRTRPSIHMPKWASRIKIQITNIRTERIQLLTPQDAIAEGIRTSSTLTHYRNYSKNLSHPSLCWTTDPIESFSSLWDSINAKRAPWHTNPWVWVIEFKIYNTLTNGGKLK